MNLSLLLVACGDYDEECNRNIFYFGHHFIDSIERL